MIHRICIFCETWESGGIESFWANLLLQLDLSDFSLDIVTAELRNSIFTKQLEEVGVHFVELSGNIYNLDKNHCLFKELLIQRKYSVVHINAYHAMSLFYLYLAERAGVPVRIAHSHNTALRSSTTRRLKLLLHRIYRRSFTRSATDLWACSSSAAAFLFDRTELKKKPCRIVPNGIDIERFRLIPDERERIRRELAFEGKYVIGNVGRLCQQKNQSFLLDVFANLIREMPESRLLLVGDGEDLKKLEEKAVKLQISDSVIFYGTTTQVERLLWAMDVFVFPSLFEGFGIAVIEAQAAGLPILCSDAVPGEAIRASEASALSLEDGVDTWCRRLKEVFPGRSDVQRINTKSDTKYNIYHIARQIAAFYRNNTYEETE